MDRHQETCPPSGGRIASASVASGGSTGRPYVVPQPAVQAAGAVARGSAALPADSVGKPWVYRADTAGFPGTTTSMPASCPANCIRFLWNRATASFGYAGGSWDFRTIDACVNAADSVGVYLKIDHHFITGLFSCGR